MAEFTQRTRTTTRHEYVLKTPANIAEMGKAYDAAKRDWKAKNPTRVEYDDTFQVEGDEIEIVLYWIEND